MKYALILAIALLAGTSGGCIVVGTSQKSEATYGKQLIDLKSAKDSGAMSEEQYEQAKAKIINKCTK